ncbi:hypothetical protein P872_13160 [Rhodonellum psychrophilum GCM71 = DSM 17998]|uniref:Uncharacterized protein n=1 Tax=Rhodonellum psychrophilum GCM71 = DSM 17998 TaxID=1123057 RepID=U5BJG1_9BACT|nr:hypothetical protein P872_13160 [Rhodonellum psychrophilum GCM71 = DSM 17998]
MGLILKENQSIGIIIPDTKRVKSKIISIKLNVS